MATYRQVHIKYWQDPFIEELEPLQRYFYLYLMTNSKTTQCGCYEISHKLIKYETGLSQNQVDSFIELLEKNNKIKFNKETNEFLLINWFKHNSFASPKVKACINKEIKNIKNQVFIDYINDIVNKNIPIDSLSIDYTRYIDTETQKEKEEEKEEEYNNKKNNKNIICVDDDLTELDKAMIDFEEFRKKIKKPLTDRAKQLILNQLNKLASTEQEMIDILNQSIMNGWQGVFELKKESVKNKKEEKISNADAAIMSFLERNREE